MADAAAKESSMEDILSSIRKIISEDETIKSTGNEVAGSKEPDPISTPPVETAPVVQVAEAPPAAVSQNNSLSLADIAANVKAGVLTTSAPAEVAPEPQPEPAVQPQQETMVEPIAESNGDNGMKLSEIVAKMAAFKDDNGKMETSTNTDPQPSEPVQASPAMPEAAPEPVSVAQQVPEQVPVVAETTPPANETEEFRTALMSPRSDDAVASSFDRLKRSAMDDMDAKTEAILRPMLREWLDENLPTMVERLVREEIERVSRGV